MYNTIYFNLNSDQLRFITII